MKPIKALVIGAALLSLVGCAHFSYRPTRSPKALDSRLEERYNESYGILSSSQKLVGERERYKLFDVSLTFANAKMTNDISVLFYKTRVDREKTPFIIVYPCNGGSYFVEKYFASYFASRGFNAGIIKRGNGFFDGISNVGDLHKVDDAFWYDVRSGKIVLDWASSLGYVDSGKLGVFGVSKGGINGTSFMALEKRISAGVIALAAGNLPELIVSVPERAVRKKVLTMQDKNGLTREELRDALSETITLDPIDVAGSIDPGKVLHVETFFDRIIPFSEQEKLGGVIGGSETIILPLGHYYSAVALPFLRVEAYNFFNGRFSR